MRVVNLWAFLFYLCALHKLRWSAFVIVLCLGQNIWQNVTQRRSCLFGLPVPGYHPSWWASSTSQQEKKKMGDWNLLFPFIDPRTLAHKIVPPTVRVKFPIIIKLFYGDSYSPMRRLIPLGGSKSHQGDKISHHTRWSQCQTCVESFLDTYLPYFEYLFC